MDLKEKTYAALIECGVNATPEQIDRVYAKFIGIANQSVEAWVAANTIIGGQNERGVLLTKEELFATPEQM